MKIVQKAPKWLLQYVKFQKIFEKACPWTSLEPILFLNLVQVNSAEKKTRLRKVTLLA